MLQECTAFIVHISALSAHVQTSDMTITFVLTVLRASASHCPFFMPDDWYPLLTVDLFFSVAGKGGHAVLPIHTGDSVSIEKPVLVSLHLARCCLCLYLGMLRLHFIFFKSCL